MSRRVKSHIKGRVIKGGNLLRGGNVPVILGGADFGTTKRGSGIASYGTELDDYLKSLKNRGPSRVISGTGDGLDHVREKIKALESVKPRAKAKVKISF